jgi:N-acetylmuramoyl-L-alanine amidase
MSVEPRQRVAAQRATIAVAAIAAVVLIVMTTRAGVSSGRGRAASGAAATDVPVASDEDAMTASPVSTPTPAAPTRSGRGALRTLSGVVVAIVGGSTGDWLVRTPCGRQAHMQRGELVTGVDVVIDPGHGGSEPGAVGPTGLLEKDLNLDVSRMIQTELRNRGWSSALTREGDYRVSLPARAEIARQLDAKAFISVHFNAEPDGPSPRPGTETYYQLTSRESRRLAGVLFEDIVASAKTLEAAWVADRDAGAKYRRNVEGDDYYGILRHSRGVTTALLELAFISNPSEEKLLRDAEVRRTFARATAVGLDRYLTTKDAGSGYVEPYDRPSPAGSDGKPRPGCVEPPL